MELVAVSGSLRAGSTHTAVVPALADLAPDIARVRVYEGLADLPAFNPHMDGDAPPEPVRALRATLGAAAAVVLSVPEYAYGIPGAFNNALDWVVSSGEFAGRPVLLLNPSPRQDGAAHAHAALRLVLTALDARPVEVVRVPVAHAQVDAAGTITDAAVLGDLRQALVAFVRSVAAR